MNATKLKPVIETMTRSRIRAALRAVQQTIEQAQDNLPSDDHPAYEQGVTLIQHALEQLEALQERIES